MQVLRYGFATGISACCTLLLPIILHEWVGLPEENAVAWSLLTAFFVNFFMIRGFVFKSQGAHLKELSLYVCASLFFRGFEYVLFLFLFSALHIYYILALVIVLLTSIIFKFVVYKFVVFKAPALAGAAMPNLTGDDLDSKNRTYHIVQDHMRLLPNYYEWTYGCAKKYIKGDVIELGCGAGIGIKTYMPSVGGIYAVDHSTELLDTIRQEYPNDQKVKTVLADLMADWTSLSEIKADTVILMDVLEHFKDDRDFLRKTGGLVKKGGVIVVKVPANKNLYSNIDIASGHYRRYDAADLEKLGRELGFKVVDIRLVNMPGFLMYGLKKNKKSNFSGTFSMGQLKVINIAIPFIMLADNILRIVLRGYYRGLSVIAVFQV